jgi:transcriptional regulator with XRE-family HTH domain
MTALHKIGASLRSYRKRLDITASELAQRSGIHRNTLSALENGHGNVELNTLLAVCEQLGLDLSLVPSRVSAVVQRTGSLPAEPKLQRIYDRPRVRQERVLNPTTVASSLTVGESGPTALQRRISARLAQSGTRTTKDKK